MAVAYFVREGHGESCTNDGQRLSLSVVEKGFPDSKPVWSAEPPTFNSETACNPVSPFLFVVIYIEGKEARGKFGAAGYWFLPGVAPAEFERRIGGTC